MNSDSVHMGEMLWGAPCSVSLGDSTYSTGREENWNYWDDFLCYYRLGAPDWLPTGATRLVGSYLDRPGFVA